MKHLRRHFSTLAVGLIVSHSALAQMSCADLFSKIDLVNLENTFDANRYHTAEQRPDLISTVPARAAGAALFHSTILVINPEAAGSLATVYQKGSSFNGNDAGRTAGPKYHFSFSVPRVEIAPTKVELQTDRFSHIGFQGDKSALVSVIQYFKSFLGEFKTIHSFTVSTLAEKPVRVLQVLTIDSKLMDIRVERDPNGRKLTLNLTHKNLNGSIVRFLRGTLDLPGALQGKIIDIKIDTEADKITIITSEGLEAVFLVHEGLYQTGKLGIPLTLAFELFGGSTSTAVNPASPFQHLLDTGFRKLSEDEMSQYRATKSELLP